MDSAERQHLLARLEQSERARRRWKGLALVAIPALALLFALALGNAITASLTLREHVIRERRAAEDALRDVEAARAQAEDALQRSQQAAVEYERAAKLLQRADSEIAQPAGVTP
jgi:hypothetical protein